MSYVAGSALAPGSTVAGYRIEALIGRGGMGAVYRAEEAGLGRKVALKVIAPELAQDGRFRERFLRESKIAASLDHPHVIPMYQAGEEDGVLYLAMRYVEGTDLAKLLAQQGALEPRRAVEILSQVAEALDAAHEKGLVHRDVKPSNVLIAEAAGKEHCYLADFGLTKRTGSLSGVSVQGDVVGTLEYVAPEQITGDPLDERADVYSLGCVLYECLTGQSPFPRATDVALLWAHVHEEPTPPSKARLDLPKELDTVLARALAKEPGRRYRTAGELVAATRSALRLVDATPARRSSRRLLAGAAALVLLALAALLAFLLTRDAGGISTVSPNAVGVIDSRSNELVAEIPVGNDPEGVALGETSAWVGNSTDGTIMRVDRAQRRIGQTLPVGGFPGDVAVANGVLWAAISESRTNLQGRIPAKPYGRGSSFLSGDPFVSRVDWFSEDTSTRLGTETTEGVVCIWPRAILAVGSQAAWFGCDTILSRTGSGASRSRATQVRLSPGSVTPEFSDVAFGLGFVWLANAAANTVTQIDPATRREVRQIIVGESPSAVAVGLGSVWVTNSEDDSVWRIDLPRSGRPVALETIAVGDGPVDVAAGDGAVWVVNSLDGTVSRIDPATNDVVATVEVGNDPRRVAVGDDEVWVTVQEPVELGPAEPTATPAG